MYLQSFQGGVPANGRVPRPQQTRFVKLRGSSGTGLGSFERLDVSHPMRVEKIWGTILGVHMLACDDLG